MKKATVEIFRLFQDTKQTSGNLMVFNEDRFPLFSSLSLERGWRNNEIGISCLPKGSYSLVLEYSDKFKAELWEIKETYPRTECKFHSASFWHDLNGCISLGTNYEYINNDDYFDLKNSRNTMKIFHSVLSDFDKVELIIDGLDWIN